jgi:hypothetical protein
MEPWPVTAKKQRERTRTGPVDGFSCAPRLGRRCWLALRPRNTVYALTSKPGDIRIDDVLYDYEEFRYRAPYKFGGREVDRASLLNVRCVVHTASGRSAHGFGSMTMGNVWAIPSERISYDTTLGAMKYVPAANKAWESRFPGIFLVKDGTTSTADLNRPGLAVVEP